MISNQLIGLVALFLCSHVMEAALELPSMNTMVVIIRHSENSISILFWYSFVKGIVNLKYWSFSLSLSFFNDCIELYLKCDLKS